MPDFPYLTVCLSILSFGLLIALIVTLATRKKSSTHLSHNASTTHSSNVFGTHLLPSSFSLQNKSAKTSRPSDQRSIRSAREIPLVPSNEAAKAKNKSDENRAVENAPDGHGFEPLLPPSLSVLHYDSTTITLKVQGSGPRGAPEGFTIQWVAVSQMKRDHEWPDTGICQVRFCAETNPTDYKLGGGEAVGIRLGQLAVTPGVFLHRDKCGTVCPTQDGKTCDSPLLAGNNYFIRVRADSNDFHQASRFSAPISQKTFFAQEQTEIPVSARCVKDPDAWSRTPDWPVNSLQLGSFTYSREQLLPLLKQPQKGNGAAELAAELAATLLNSNASAGKMARITDRAQATLRELRQLVPPIGPAYLSANITEHITNALSLFNTGKAGHNVCPDPSSLSASVTN